MSERTEEEWEHLFLEGDVAGTLAHLWGVPFAASNAMIAALRAPCETCSRKMFVCPDCDGTGWALPAETP